MKQTFSEDEINNLYRIIESRRDVRSGFKTEPVPEWLLKKVLNAAHHAPSVGFMQPWNFILIDDSEQKTRVKKAFQEARKKEADLFSGDKRALYDSLKLEGIEEAPLNILVSCQRDRGGESGLGRSIQDDMDIFSTVCAVQNLWLAARAEGIGVGWVSIIEKQALKDIFKLPENVEPVAYLCAGFVEEFAEKPELEKAGWEQRLELEGLIYKNSWGKNG